MKGQNLSLLEKQQLVESYQSDIKKMQFQIALLKEAVAELKEGIREDRKAAPAKPAATTATAKAAAPAKARTTTRTKKTSKATKPAAKRGRPKAAPKTAKVEAAVAETVSATTTTSETVKPKAAKKPGRPAKAKKTTTKKASTTPAKRGRKPNQKVGGYRLSDWDSLIVDGIKSAGKALVKSDLLDLAAKKNEAEKLNLDEKALNVKISQSLHKLANRRDDLVKIDFPGRGFAYALAEWKTSKGDLPKKYTI